MSEVFVSYAHADDLPFAEGTPGWVTALADRLEKSLMMRRGGSRVAVWIDHRLEPEKQVDGALRDRVRRAECFVAVLSPRYLESPWCRKELDAFIAHAGEQGERVFLLEMSPTSRDEWPRGIRNISARKFWAQGFDDPTAMPLGWPVADPAQDRPYWRALNELSHFVSARLQAAGAATRDDNTRCVWIADPTDHVLESWERLAGALRQQGYTVRPSAPGEYPTAREDDYRAALDADLTAADTFVQLLGPHPGRRPSWSELPYTMLQAAAARATSANRSQAFSLWRSPDIQLETITNPEYAQLLTGAAAGGLEDFQRHVLSRLAPKPVIDTVSLAIAAPDTATMGALSICVSADGPDRELGQRVRDMLFTLGADVSLTPEPAPDQPPSQWRQDYETILGASHGVVIIYGSTPPSWVQAQVQASRKLLARTRRGVWGALLDGPPGGQPDHGVRSHNVVLLDCRTGVAPEPLKRFLDTLRSGGTEASAAHA